MRFVGGRRLKQASSFFLCTVAARKTTSKEEKHMKNQNLRGHSGTAEGIRWLCSLVALTLGIAPIGAMPLAAQGCQPVEDAMNKIYTIPTHVYETQIVQYVGQNKPYPYKSEQVYSGGVVYENSDGKWTRSSVALQQVKKMEEDNRKKGKATCRYLRGESVNGEMAAVYSLRTEMTDKPLKADGQIWISKPNGLPLRHEADIDGDGMKSHLSTRYEYANVRPPL
jgi:hypothetical protein